MNKYDFTMNFECNECGRDLQIIPPSKENTNLKSPGDHVACKHTGIYVGISHKIKVIPCPHCVKTGEKLASELIGAIEKIKNIASGGKQK